jgi:hypothetical protein
LPFLELGRSDGIRHLLWRFNLIIGDALDNIAGPHATFVGRTARLDSVYQDTSLVLRERELGAGLRSQRLQE